MVILQFLDVLHQQVVEEVDLTKMQVLFLELLEDQVEEDLMVIQVQQEIHHQLVRHKEMQGDPVTFQQ
jgi:hypothetical protein